MKKVIALSMLLFSITFCILAKPVFEIKLINSFPINELQGEWNFIRFCVADTLLLVIDTSDSTRTISYAYDFQGNKIDTFKMPADSLYGQFFFVNYLYDSRQVTLSGLNTGNIDYYSLEGNPLGSKKILSDWSLYLNALEYKNTPYYIVFNLREAEFGDMVTGTMTWCREKSNGEMQLLRKQCMIKDWLKPNKGPFQYLLLMDNNKDHYMTMVDERETEYVVTNPDTSGWNISRIKRRKNDYISKLVTGENYFILFTWNTEKKYTSTSGVYNNSGKKLLNLSALKKYNTKGENIIDIVGDKMISYNYKDKLVKIYQVELTANK